MEVKVHKTSRDHYGYIEWIERLDFGKLPVEDQRTMKNEWRTVKNDEEFPQNRLRNVSEALWKHLALDFLHENTFFHPK